MPAKQPARKNLPGKRLSRQIDVLADILRTAARRGHWLTLAELERMTSYPQASISAQLRHLRKPRNGALQLEKRVAEIQPGPHGEQAAPKWEYRLLRPKK